MAIACKTCFAIACEGSGSAATPGYLIEHLIAEFIPKGCGITESHSSALKAKPSFCASVSKSARLLVGNAFTFAARP